MQPDHPPRLARWWDHLAARGHADPRAAAPDVEDFLAFGRLSTLERLRPLLAAAAPGQVGPLRLACRELRRTKARPAPTGGQRGPAPALSVPEDRLPDDWRRALQEMRRARARLDAGRWSPSGPTPPAASMIRGVGYTLRALAAACLAEGLPAALDRGAVRAWLDAARARGCRPSGIGLQLRHIRRVLAWMDRDPALQGELAALARAETQAADAAPKAKDRKLRECPLALADVMAAAEELAARADAAGPATRDGAVLRLHACVLALTVCCPLRIGDLHRLRIGEELRRDAEDWSLAIRTRKTGADYERPAIWPEVGRHLDALLAMDAPGGELWTGYDMRAGTPLFSLDGGMTGLSADWVSDVWERHTGHGAHIVRTLWHDELLIAGGERDTWLALALCGQTSKRTARHYRTRAARRAAGQRGRGMLAAARERADRPDAGR